jgi:flagellar biosynthetic protein FlhB
MMRRSLSLSPAAAGDSYAAINAFRDAAAEALLACAPVLAAAFLAALAAPLAIGGWNLSGEALGMRFERINPLTGIGRLFSARSAAELGKTLVKFAVVGTIAVALLWSQADDLLRLSMEPVGNGIAHAAQLTGQALLAMTAGLVLIAAIDVPFQLWQYTRDLRMTRDEIRQELKESEGSPETRGRIRAIQQAMARRRMMQEVPTASVVITNPTHYAVALRYDEKRNRAPVVVAKGADEVAARIRELATGHGVPLVSAPPLARVLYRHVDLGVEIPAVLYVAVAQVLTYVAQLAGARRAGMPPPVPPTVDPSVEQSFRRAEG